jgi:uracil-DNA glycosylase
MEAPNNDLFKYTSGPTNAKIVLVGEAWGSSEASARRPFVGSSGHELDKMLYEAGLPRASILCTNVIHAQPARNDFTEFLYSNDIAKKEKINEYYGIYPRDPLRSGIGNLWRLLDEVNPSLVICAGNWPLHVLTDHAKPATKKGFKLPTGIVSWRGSQTHSRPSPKGKRFNVLPIIHPAAILREWGYRPVTIHDLRSRAWRYLAGHLDWNPPPHTFFWNPSYDAVISILNSLIARACYGELWLSVDLETYQKRYISVLGLADKDMAICIPFFSFSSNKQLIPYFTLEQEQEIWLRAKVLLENPNTKIIGQNFVYDTQFFDRHFDIQAIVTLDTMVAHHLLFPGTPKGLHNLASLYSNHYCYWKDESEDQEDPEEDAESKWKYNCKDTRETYDIAFELMKQLTRADGFLEDEACAATNEPRRAGGMWEHYQEKMEQWALARTMTRTGILIDEEVKKRFSLELFHTSNSLEQWLLLAVPDHLQHNAKGGPWCSSAQATMALLYDHIGLPPVLHKKTKRPTADDDAINSLLERRDARWLEPLLGRLSAYRSVGVFRKNFVDAKLGITGRLHSQFNVSHPETHRWSSAHTSFDEGTNLQNIPKVED